MAGEGRALHHGGYGGDLGTGNPRLSEDRSPVLIAERARRRVLWRLMPFLILIFFIGYFLLEIPGSLIVDRYSARKWFARIMISWGLMAALTGFVQNSSQFY